WRRSGPTSWRMRSCSTATSTSSHPRWPRRTGPRRWCICRSRRTATAPAWPRPASWRRWRGTPTWSNWTRRRPTTAGPRTRGTAPRRTAQRSPSGASTRTTAAAGGSAPGPPRHRRRPPSHRLPALPGGRRRRPRSPCRLAYCGTTSGPRRTGRSVGERPGTRELRVRSRTPAVPRISRRGQPVHLRDRDRAPFLPRQPGGPAGPLRGRRGLLRTAARGRLGVGHLPLEPLRALRARGDLQGRQHRGAQQAGHRPALTSCGGAPVLHSAPASPATPPFRWVWVSRSAAVVRRGEDLGAAHLSACGWQIVELSVRLTQGELDIVAVAHITLVFVEVKTRRSFVTGVPQAAVTPDKLR